MESQEHARHSVRLPHYDYAQPGAYFVTVCVKSRKPILSRVVGESIALWEAGKIVQEAWQDLPQHYENTELDEFVVMPNHVHGIIWLTDDKATDVGAGFKPAPTKNAKRHGLPEIVRGFKTFSARRINQLRETTGKAFWQRGYYEHIVRDEDDLYQHRKYVQENPLKWAADEYYREAAMPDRTTTPETCLVCQKHRGENPVPGGALYEDDLVYVSHSFIPEGKEKVYLGTLFVEPRRHAAAFEDLSDEEAQALGLWVSCVARALKSATQAEHVYVCRFGHHVDHLHVWVVPRYPGTPEEFWGLKADEWPGAPHGGEAEIAELCEQIRSALKVEIK